MKRANNLLDGIFPQIHPKTRGSAESFRRSIPKHVDRQNPSGYYADRGSMSNRTETHAVRLLIEPRDEVFGIDNLNDYYDQYSGHFFERFHKAFRDHGSRIELFFQS